MVTMAGLSVRTAMPSGVFTGMTRPASCAMAAVPLPRQKSQQAIEVVSTVLASALGGADVSVQGALDANRCKLDGVQIVQTWCQTQSLVCPSPPPRLRPGLRAFRCASPSATWPAA